MQREDEPWRREKETERWKESEEIMKENSCRRVAERNLWSIES